MEKTQRALNDAYAEWKSIIPSSGLNLEEFTAPYLLNVTPGYASAERRVLIIGQESGDWDWVKEELCKPGWDYPPYPFADIRTLGDFIRNDDAIKALTWGYEHFRFGCAQRIAGRGFWRGFHGLASGCPAVMAANVAKCHSRKGDEVVPNLSPKEFQSFAAAQKKLLREEIEILRPDVCIFLSGPNYDGLIANSFPDAVCEPVADIPVNVFARIKRPPLPIETFRTYHPNARWKNAKQYRDRVRDILKNLIPVET
ncbi:MAG: hypothetical protein ABI306_06030 [Caulobacteraceae bacterium]